MTFWENFTQICEDRNTKPTPLVKKMGLSPSKVTMWKNGSLPKEDVMVRLAQELNCTVMDFFEDNYDYSYRLKQDEEILIEGFHNMSESQRHRLLAYYYAILEGTAQ